MVVISLYTMKPSEASNVPQYVILVLVLFFISSVFCLFLRRQSESALISPPVMNVKMN